MASLIQWTWIWPNSGRQWRTEEPGMLQSLGSQRVRHELMIEHQQLASMRGSPRSASARFKLLPPHWDLEHVEILCVPFKSPLSLASCSGDLSFWCTISMLWSLRWISNPCSPAIVIISPLVGLPTWVCGSWLYPVSTPPTFLLWLLFCIFNCGKIFSTSLQVVLWDSCSVNSCDFEVPVRGRELSWSFCFTVLATSLTNVSQKHPCRSPQGVNCGFSPDKVCNVLT